MNGNSKSFNKGTDIELFLLLQNVLNQQSKNQEEGHFYLDVIKALQRCFCLCEHPIICVRDV